MPHTREQALELARSVVRKREDEKLEAEARRIAQPLEKALEAIERERAQGKAWPITMTYCIDYPSYSADVDTLKLHLPALGYRVETTYADGAWVNGYGYQRMCTISVRPAE